MDPLTKKYPELTPYQFASNAPISGIDLDGLEYIHFTVILNKDGTIFKKFIAEDFRSKPEAEMNKIHKTTNFYRSFSAGFGPEGKGVKYTYFKIGENEMTFAGAGYEVSQNTISSEISRHGLYAGAGSITAKGPLFEAKLGAEIGGSGYYDFGYKPIDMVDALSRKHDMEEDYAGFQGWQDPRNIFADIRFVKGLEKYLENVKDKNYVDPFTGRKPSKEAKDFAKNAVTLFSIEIGSKKLKIMEQFKKKQISTNMHEYILKAIRYYEGQDAELPKPSQKDK